MRRIIDVVIGGASIQHIWSKFLGKNIGNGMARPGGLRLRPGRKRLRTVHMDMRMLNMVAFGIIETEPGAVGSVVEFIKPGVALRLGDCMFKLAKSSFDEVKDVMRAVYQENPKHWPNGLTPEHFDGGIWAIKVAETGQVCGFLGWQERDEVQPLLDRPVDVRRKEAGDRHVPGWDSFFKSMGCRHVKTGYYSIGILREHRRNGFAKEALQKLISMKSAGVDQVKALIMSSNAPSLALADSLGVEKIVKRAFAILLDSRQPES